VKGEIMLLKLLTGCDVIRLIWEGMQKEMRYFHITCWTGHGIFFLLTGLHGMW